ncbi:MAG TPA: hypothetical protein VGM92_09190, partial [Candidatus Kapabacteria bacterium]
MFTNNRFSVSLIFLVFLGFGCKSSTGPNSGSNASGTLLFGAGGSEVAEEVLGSNASTNLFHGFDPSFASGGRIIYDANGSYTSNGREQILISSPDGTNTQTILDLQTSFAAVPIHPRMSPGRQVCQLQLCGFSWHHVRHSVRNAYLFV